MRHLCEDGRYNPGLAADPFPSAGTPVSQAEQPGVSKNGSRRLCLGNRSLLGIPSEAQLFLLS